MGKRRYTAPPQAATVGLPRTSARNHPARGHRQDGSPEKSSGGPLERRSTPPLSSLWRGLPPRKTRHVLMMRGSLRTRMAAGQWPRPPLPKVSLSMYKGLPTTASAKAPPKTFLFGERGLGRHNPMKETSAEGVTLLTRRWHCPPAPNGPRPPKIKTAFGRQLWYPFPPNEREGEPRQLFREASFLHRRGSTG